VIDPTLAQTLVQRLANECSGRIYAVLDGASIPNLPDLLAQNGLSNVCLMPGELEPELALAAPYLVEIPIPSPFAEIFLAKGLGQHWGILAVSDANLRTMRIHLRKLLSVWDPNGKPLFFRYYDPRVLRTYLPTCRTDELAEVFGPANAFYAEAPEPDALLRFAIGAEGLGTQTLSLARPADSD
jgi:hypothetical protein